MEKLNHFLRFIIDFSFKTHYTISSVLTQITFCDSELSVLMYSNRDTMPHYYVNKLKQNITNPLCHFLSYFNGPSLQKGFTNETFRQYKCNIAIKAYNT